MSQVFVTLEEAHNRNARYVDCRHLLTDTDYGQKSYLRMHLPGAVFAHLDHDLAGAVTSTSGRHPLPPLEEFIHWLENHAISPDQTIICYDNFGGGIAARLWWMLKQLGFPKVFIMTNSLEDWIDAGYPVNSSLPTPEPIELDLSISSWEDGPYEIQSLHDIEQQLGSAKLIDSRSSERFLGLEEPYDEIAGHIPGAVNLYWQSHLSDSQKPQLSRARFSQLLQLDELQDYTVYCGSGVTACFNLAVIEELDLPRPKYYPGSYSEWSRNHPDLIDSEMA